MKLGSLFDGSGGFPLAGSLCGITPAFASEVEPYPIAVTTSRFPNMKHLGSVTDINGAEIEPVDIITFGSPCQDLSVAGKRAGLKHEANGDEETTRSGLFLEAVRIIKEMRRETNGLYPNFAIWENVPGAFSSNGGDDFRVVLEELIKIVEPGASVPSPDKGRWPYSDAYVGDGWSLAYRTLDAQYWGVPQRRRRIYLVLDLRGERAHKVLFEREGLRGYFETGRAPWQGTAADAENCPGAADSQGKCYGIVSKGNGEAWPIEEKHMALSCGGGQAGQGYPCAMVPYTLKIRSGCEGGGKGALIQTDMSATLATNNDQYLFQPIGFDGYNSTDTGDKSATLGVNCGMSTGRNGVVVPCTTVAFAQNQRNEVRDLKGVAGALAAEPGMKQQTFICMATQQGGAEIRTDDKAPTITDAAGMSGNNQPVVCYDIGEARLRTPSEYKEQSPTLTARCGTGGNNVPAVVMKEQHLFENHSQDTRYKGPLDVAPIISATYGMGGNNQPFVVEQKVYRKGTRPHNTDEAQKWESADVANTLNTFDQGESRANELVVEKRVYESHPMDSRIKELEDVGPTVSCKWHKGAADTPLVCEPRVINLNKDDVQSKAILDPAGIAPALYAGECRGGGGECYVLDKEPKAETNPTHDQPVYCLQGNGINRADTAGCNGAGWREGASYTLNTIDRPAVAYATDVGFLNSIENTSPTLLARSYKDPHLVSYPEDKIHYIVRRLTPTECARLQGFPDKWGHITIKEDFTDEEYSFWLNVRNTHAAINGKTVKEYTKDQMLTWYNKLHTDSAEYKMWGNGIALPTALYVLQGIADALNPGQKADEPPLTITRETKETETMEYNDRAEEERDCTMEKLSTIQKRENLNHIYRMGEPGPGGAYHDYDIYEAHYSPETQELPMACIEFQKGPRNDPNARHGILDSDLLEIVRDRLKAFQSGPMATEYNAQALRHIEEALMWMNRRVEDRIERQVLGTMEK